MPADSPLREAIRRGLTASARALLHSIKAAKPRWELMELPGIETLPAIRWKLANIKKMSPDKRRAAYGRLQKSALCSARCAT